MRKENKIRSDLGITGFAINRMVKRIENNTLFESHFPRRSAKKKRVISVFNKAVFRKISNKPPF